MSQNVAVFTGLFKLLKLGIFDKVYFIVKNVQLQEHFFSSLSENRGSIPDPGGEFRIRWVLVGLYPHS
jgi:hypothetical protein